jgi:hypothetical protein
MKRQKLAFGIFLIAITMINPGCTHDKHQAKIIIHPLKTAFTLQLHNSHQK